METQWRSLAFAGNRHDLGQDFHTQRPADRQSACGVVCGGGNAELRLHASEAARQSLRDGWVLLPNSSRGEGKERREAHVLPLGLEGTEQSATKC